MARGHARATAEQQKPPQTFTAPFSIAYTNQRESGAARERASRERDRREHERIAREVEVCGVRTSATAGSTSAHNGRARED